MITLSTEELRAILQNKHKFSTCLDCNGKGKEVYREYLDVNEELGDLEEAYDEPEYIEQEYKCESCNGLGGFISFPSDGEDAL